jgi:hypothetical protein
MASETWSSVIESLAARSAMVRETRKMRSWARAERPRASIASFSAAWPAASSWQSWSHAAIQLARTGTESLQLNGAGLVNLLAHGGTTGAVGGFGEIVKRHWRHFNVQIDAIEERPGDAAHVLLDRDGGTLALVLRIAEEAAWARIHRGDEDEVGGEGGWVRGAADGDAAFFKWLAERFEAAAIELRKFVEEEDAVVGERDLARLGNRSAADHAGVRDRMVRAAEGAGAQ